MKAPLPYPHNSPQGMVQGHLMPRED